jgi:hypothetical protein
MNPQSAIGDASHESLSGSLNGEGAPNASWVQQLAHHALMHVALSPLFLFIGAVLIAGAMGLVGKIDEIRGGRGQFAELWPCFPAALGLVVVASFVYRYFRHVSRRTIQEFHYVDGELRYWTAEAGDWATQRVADIRAIGECPGARGSVRISFANGACAVVSPQIENGSALVERLTRAKRRISLATRQR